MISTVDARVQRWHATFGIRRRLQAPASTLALLSLALTGCYSVVTINVGSANHEAATASKPIPPEVECAALAERGIKTDAITVEGSQPCGSAPKAAAK
jgi:hypothetical protein